MSLLNRLLAAVDALSLRSGQAVAFLLLPICGAMVFEVIARYMFNAPTIWSTEIVVMLAGALYIIGGAYTQYLRGHISVDTLYDYLPPRWQTATRLFVHAPLFFLYVGVLLWEGSGFAWESMVENERSGSLWNPVIWPYKFVVPLGALLIFLQGLAQFIRDVRALVTGEDLVVGPSEEIDPEL
jgi:TRAP-type mannitol/chloroaromatic compound transport system permease small subunit